MRLTSQWNGQIFWRIFQPNDTTYAFGLKEGTMRGGVVDIDAQGLGQVKLEIKRDGLLGAFIVRAGQLWSTSDALILSAQGQLGVEQSRPPFQMSLASSYSRGRVYWRVFRHDDSVYAVGLSEGYLDRGQSTMISIAGVEQLKLECKRDNLAGPLIAGAGPLYGRDSHLEISDQGLSNNGTLVVPNPTPMVDLQLRSARSAGVLFWRVFRPEDRAYLFGLQEGTLAPGQAAHIVIDGVASVQLELKRDQLLGTPVLAPGGQFRSGASLTVTDTALLDGGATVASVQPPPQPPAHVPFGSRWSFGKVYWRTFHPDDTAYAVGLADGILAAGQSVVLQSGDLAELKLELRQDGLFGTPLIRPDRRWRAGDQLTLTDDGLANHGVVVLPVVRPPHPVEVLRLTSAWPTPVFWRVFDETDRSYVVGLAEGVVQPGQTAAVALAQVERFQLELKSQSLAGELLIGAGAIWAKGVHLTLDAHRQLRADRPPPLRQIAIRIDDGEGGSVPFVHGRVAQVAGGVRFTSSTDQQGRVDYHGGDLEIRRGELVVCTARAGELAGGQLVIDRARMSAAFLALRTAFLARLGEIRAAAQRTVELSVDRIQLDFANLLARRTIDDGGTRRPLRFTDFYRPHDRSELEPDGSIKRDADGHDIKAYVTDHPEHGSTDNPGVVASNLVFATCVARVLEGSDQYDSLIGALITYFVDLRDPQRPVYRRRASDRPEAVQRRLAVVQAEPDSEARTKELALLAVQAQGVDDWEMEPSLDEYAGMCHALASAARLGPETAEIDGRPFAVAGAATDMLADLVSTLGQNGYFITVRAGATDDLVLAARGPGALLSAYAINTALAQVLSRDDLSGDADIAPARYAALRAVSEAHAARLPTPHEGLELCDVYNLAVTGQLPGLLAAALVAGPLAAAALAQVAALLIPDPFAVATVGPLVLPIVLGATVAGGAMLAPVLQHPHRPSAYYAVSAYMMTNPLWGFSPWWSSALFDRFALAAFPSSELARAWSGSLPRQDPKGGYKSTARQLRDCAQLLCTGSIDDVTAFIDRIVDPTTTQKLAADSYNEALDETLLAWSVACLALGLRPGVDWRVYRDVANT
jgi:hypothetical protein